MSGPSSPAPTSYQPSNQAGADQGYQQGANTLATNAAALQGQVNPAYANVTSNVTNNPYYQTSQNYAGLTSGIAGNMVAPSQFGAAQNSNQYGGLASAIGGQIAGQNAAGIAPGVYNQGMGQAGQVAGSGYIGTAGGILNNGLQQAGQIQNNGTTNASLYNLLSNLGQSGAIGNSGYQQVAQGLLGSEFAAGNQLLQTAYDPQQTLYNQQYQQMLDQQNAINSMNGVATSPYGAGVAGQAAQNFNTSWENQQLARQAQGLQGFTNALQGGVSDYSGIMGAATGAQTNLQNAGFGNYASTMGANTNAANQDISTGTAGYGNVLGSGSNAYNALASGAVNNYAGLTGAEANALASLGQTANSAYNTGSGLNKEGLQTLSTAGQVQNAAYMQQQQAVLAALAAQIQGSNAANQGTQQATDAYGNYLNIGQTATQVAQNAWQQNTDQNNSQMAAIGEAAGTALQVAMMIPW